jgi:hypothetical protein
MGRIGEASLEAEIQRKIEDQRRDDDGRRPVVLESPTTIDVDSHSCGGWVHEKPAAD